LGAISYSTFGDGFERPRPGSGYVGSGSMVEVRGSRKRPVELPKPDIARQITPMTMSGLSDHAAAASATRHY
jgi:hypothetical protein